MNNIISCDARARDTKREKVTLRRYSLYLYRSHALDSLFLKGQPPIPPSPSFLCSELRRHGARRALAQRGQDPPRPPAGKYMGEEGGKFNLRQRRTNSGKRGGNEMVDIDERFFLGPSPFCLSGAICCFTAHPFSSVPSSPVGVVVATVEPITGKVPINMAYT